MTTYHMLPQTRECDGENNNASIINHHAHVESKSDMMDQGEQVDFLTDLHSV